MTPRHVAPTTLASAATRAGGREVAALPWSVRWLARLDMTLSARVYYAFAVGLGLVYVLHLFPLNFFLGSNGFWFATRTDPTQHVTGMWAFVQDRWRFPLLWTKLLNAPEGVSVAFTDSIPLAALLFKSIYHLLPPGSQYFGVWVFLCYVLQGVAGAWAASRIGGRTATAALAGTLFPVMMPSLMIRIPHAALQTQCLLIAMLGLYYSRHAALIGTNALIVRGTGLLLLAGAIHPYLLAMGFALYAAALLDDAWRQPSLRLMARPLAGMLVPLPLLALLLYSFGYFPVAGGLPPPEVGFTQGSMNLLSPLFGTNLARPRFFPGSPNLVLDATGLQIDGHNYLGLSQLLMLGFLIVARPARVLAFLRSNWIMALILAGMSVYSLSNVVWLGGHVILHYPLPAFIEPLTRIFRGSGRFFWPMGYALLFSAIGFFLTRPHPAWRLALLLLLGLQYADTAPHRGYLAEAASRKPVFDYDRNEWDARVARASAVYLLPAYGCGASPFDALFLQYFTSLHAVPFNTGFVARVAVDCAAKEAVLARPRRPGELFVFARGHYWSKTIADAMRQCERDWCQDEAIGTVCQMSPVINQCR